MSTNHLVVLGIGFLAFVALGFLFVLFMNAIGAGARKQKERLKQTAEGELADLFVFVDYNKLFYAQVGLFLLVPIVVWILTANPLFSLLSLVVPFVLPRFVVNRLRKRRLKQFVSQFPDALMTLSASLKAGTSMAVALENLVSETKPPINQEFAIMLRAQRLGTSFEDSLKAMEERLPVPEFSMFSAGVRIARETGGNLADMLESLADTLYRKLQVEGKIDALTAQGKIQGLVMALLPIGIMVILSFMEPKMMHPLFHTFTGWVVLVVVGFMEFMGWLGIRKITNIDV
jgi:tight adherence protein B